MITLAAGNTIAGVAGAVASISCTILGMELNTGVEAYKVLAQSQLPNAAATVYTAPAGTQTFIKAVMLANVTAGPIAGVALFINGTAAVNQITGAFSIPANGLAIIDDAGLHVYDVNGNLQAFGGPGTFDSTLPSADVQLIKSGVVGAAPSTAHRDHQHQSPGGVAAIVANVGPISTSEAQMVGATIPANFIQAGTTFRLWALGQGTTSTAPGVTTFKVRFGPVTLTGTTIATEAATNAASISGRPWEVEALVLFRVPGVANTATVMVIIIVRCEVTGGLYTTAIAMEVPVQTAAGFDTTVQNILELTAFTGAATSTLTVNLATIEVVKL